MSTAIASEVTVTVDDVIRALDVAGCQVVVAPDGVGRVLGAVPQWAFDWIRKNRDEFLAAWDENIRNRYLRPPPDDLPLMTRGPRWNSRVYRRMDQYLSGQTDAVCRWALARYDRYRDEKGFSQTDAVQAAALDVVRWQMARHEDPVGVLQLLV